MSQLSKTSHSEEETIAIGQKVGRHLTSGDIVCLFGDLGAGKTTIVKGIAQGLKVNPKKVNSPTYVLMNMYDGKLPLYHFDLYRLDNFQDIGMGYDEFLYGDGISLVEWADKMGEWLPEEYLRLELIHQKSGGRKLKISARGKRYKQKLEQLTERL